MLRTGDGKEEAKEVGVKADDKKSEEKTETPTTEMAPEKVAA